MSCKLKKINPSAQTRGRWDNLGYKEGSGNYLFDNNGNMYSDHNNTTIGYNFMNLPKLVTFNISNTIKYSYTASGVKVQKMVESPGNGNKVVDCIGPFLYEDNDLKCIFTSEGRLAKIDDNGQVLWKYEYNLTDHLGNVRAVFAAHDNGIPELMQQTDYYPFGMVMAQQETFKLDEVKNKYLYNGKELQDDDIGIKLGWYDFGARMYDPQLGRWHVLDAMAEGAYEYTPYRYAFNNPIRYIDPDGNFELDKATIQQYPRLAYYLQNNIQNITSNQGIMAGLLKFGQLSANSVANHVQWGKGPKIIASSLVGSNGQFTPNSESNVIEINKDILDQLEKALMSGSEEALLLVASTILHEYTHFGDDQDGIDFPGEEGQEFEEFVYGVDIDDLAGAKKVIEQYKKRQEEENKKKSQGATALLSNFNNLEEGTYVWNGTAWVK